MYSNTYRLQLLQTELKATMKTLTWTPMSQSLRNCGGQTTPFQLKRGTCKQVHLWEQTKEPPLLLQHRWSSEWFLPSCCFIFFFHFSLLTMIHFLQMDLFVLHRGHPALLITKLQHFLVLISVCGSLSEEVTICAIRIPPKRLHSNFSF